MSIAEITRIRHCEPPGRANARPMTGSAKQSTVPLAEAWIASSLSLLAMTVDAPVSHRRRRWLASELTISLSGSEAA
ncbi:MULTISPECIES: hypothetical protein [unclassified Bradyrhizobium]